MDRSGLERFHDLPLPLYAKRLPQHRRGAQDALRQKCCVHQRLAAFVEIHEVGRTQIGGRVQGGLRPFNELFLSFGFCFIQSFSRQPGRDPGEQTTEGFQVRVSGALDGIGGLDGHRLF